LTIEHTRRYRIGVAAGLTREAMALLEELMFVDASEAQVPTPPLLERALRFWGVVIDFGLRWTDSSTKI